MEVLSHSPVSSALPVRLRAAHAEDAALLKAWRAEESVRRHQPLSDLTVGQLRQDLASQRMADLYRGLGEKFQWVIELEEEPVGWITLVVSNWEHGLAEVGYALRSGHQGRGIMPRALELLLTDLFRRTSIERVEARCAVNNLASQKVLLKVGFVYEGLLRAYFRLRGERVDNFLYAVLRADVGE